MKRTLAPADLYTYLTELFASGKFDRLLGDRFFQATVNTVIGSGPYQVTVIKPEDNRVDSGFVLQCFPGYVPRIGDICDCMWRDLNVAYVLGAIVKGTSPGGPNTGSVPVKIAEQVTANGDAAVTFSSIPSGFRHLRIEHTSRTNDAGTSWAYLVMQFNADTAAKYDDNFDTQINAVQTVSEITALTAARCGNVIQGGAAASYAARGIIEIPNYGDGFKKSFSYTCMARWVTGTNGAAVINGRGHWDSTAAISSVKLYSSGINFAASCVFTLYGIP